MRLALLGRLRGDGGNHAAIWGDVRFCEGDVACARAASVDGDERRGHASGQGHDYGVRGGTRHNHKGSPCASFHPKLHVYLAADETFADSGDCEGRDILSGAIIFNYHLSISAISERSQPTARAGHAGHTSLVAREDSLRPCTAAFPAPHHAFNIPPRTSPVACARCQPAPPGSPRSRPKQRPATQHAR